MTQQVLSNNQLNNILTLLTKLNNDSNHNSISEPNMRHQYNNTITRINELMRQNNTDTQCCCVHETPRCSYNTPTHSNRSSVQASSRRNSTYLSMRTIAHELNSDSFVCTLPYEMKKYALKKPQRMRRRATDLNEDEKWYVT